MDLQVIQEQLRPKTWDDLIGLDFKPNGINTEKELLINMMDRDDALSIIFYGPPGTGKTSAVMLAAERYLGSYMDSKFKKYNASTSVLVDTIKNDVIDFAGSEDDTGLRNIIFFDEVDGVKWQAQDSLRAVMEEYSYSCIFLMACNKITRLHSAIRSRSAEFKMDRLPRNVCVDWFKNSADICNVEVSDAIIANILDYYNGDLRAVISDFFTKFRNKSVLTWQSYPTHAEEIYNAADRINAYLKLAYKTYIDPISLIHDLFKLNKHKGAKILSTASDRILNGGDPMINICMAIESL